MNTMLECLPVYLVRVEELNIMGGSLACENWSGF